MKRTYYSSLFIFNRSLFLSLLITLVVTTSANAQTGPFSLFNSENPSLLGQDGTSLEIGFKFKVTQAGTISAIRFYKGTNLSNNTLFTVNLWTNGNSTTPGTNLASASNSSITGTGWRQISITPTTLYPNTVYVISLFSFSGYYSYTNYYFPNSPDDASRPPFIIVGNSEDPAGVGNGVWRYTTTSAFPYNGGNGTNYFIDLVFNTTFSLPVTLSEFKATPSGNNVVVSWKTSHESNNKGFAIERSNNGSDWYAVNFVNGAGESSITRNYSYADKALAAGTYYYRIKQVDLDGKYSFTEVVSATISGKGTTSLFQNYPNPFAGSTTIRFDLARTQHARLSVIDMSGREVRVLTDKMAQAGSNVLTLNGTGLGKQTYIIRLQTDDGVLTKKILVK